MSPQIGVRGRKWFQVLTGKDTPQLGDPGSILAADAPIGSESALFLCVIPNPASRFPCARDGQVGLEEAYALAVHVRHAIEADRNQPRSQKRPIVAIVDVKSQAYGRREETAGIFLAAAAASDAYDSARMAGHAVIALVVGHAFSGGFLMHGYQANRILALDDPGVMIHAMHKEAAARVTRRSVSELEQLGHEITPMSYDIREYAKIGLLHKLLHVDQPSDPTDADTTLVKQALLDSIEDARKGPVDLRIRFQSGEAKEIRKAGLAAIALMERQWQET